MLLFHKMDTPVWYALLFLSKADRIREDVRRINLRSLSIFSSTLNVNVYSD